jgi:hypothetical protein
MTPRRELEQAIANLDERLESLRQREAELATVGTLFADLQTLAVRVDVAHYSRQRLVLELELAAGRITDLKDLQAVGAAREMLGAPPAKKGAPKSVTADLATAEAEHGDLTAKHAGLATLIAERTRAWSDFRDANHGALRSELDEESETLRDELAAWVAQRSAFEQRWRALDKRYAAINRPNYATGSGQGGDLPAFPLRLEGQPVLPVPCDVDAGQRRSWHATAA